MFNLSKQIIILFIFLSSVLALILNYSEDFDPVQMAVELKKDHKRDQALDVIEFSLENKIGDQKNLKNLHEEYRYTFEEKSKDLFLHGAFKGEVFNMYSGIGCIAADLAVIGDIRDLSKQGYYFFSGKDVDYIVTGLSAVGVGTTLVEATGAGVAVDAGVSAVKSSVKYVSKSFKKIPDSLLNGAVAGRKFSPKEYKKIWILFKETKYSIPNLTMVLSKIKNVKYLDNAIELTKKLKKGGVIFINKTGEAGLKVYENFKKLRLRKLFVSGFKRNPRAVLGITKFHTIIHSAKILKKHGFLLGTVSALSIPATLLATLPLWVTAITLVGSGGYLGWNIFRIVRNGRVNPPIPSKILKAT